MTRAEVRTLQDWVITEWWDEGDWDADVLYDIDPDGFWALLDDEGQIVGGLSTIAPTDEAGSVSHLYLSPAARGKGIWRRSLADLFTLLGHRLKDNMTVTNFVMPDARAAVEPWGFVPLHDEIRMVRAAGPAPAATDNLGVVDARGIPFEEVVSFDAAHSGRAREALWHRWLHLPDAMSGAVVEHGRLLGIGTIRPSARGHRIGPLFATDASVAERLLRRLIPEASGTRIAMDVPECNPAAPSLAQALGFVEEFRTIRMVRGRIPDVPWQECYATVMLHLD